ncbi:MAG: DoxX family protein [Bdellovibrionota bacterium]
MKLKFALRALLSTGFVSAGIAHLRSPAIFLPLMPPFLPFPIELIYVSGVCEIALGALMMIPRFRKLAGVGLVLLLIAVFPANVYMALNDQVYPNVQSGVRWGRLPLQLVLIWCVLWVSSIAESGSSEPGERHVAKEN